MAISKLQVVQVLQVTAVGSLPIAITPNSATSQLVLVISFQGTATNAVVGSVTDTGGLFWTDWQDVSNGSATPLSVSIWQAPNTSTSANTITVNWTGGSGQNIQLALYEIGGAFITPDFPAIGSAHQNTSTPSIGSLSIALSGDLVILGLMAAASATITPSGGWVQDKNGANGQSALSLSNPATGAFTASPGTLSASGQVSQACYTLSDASLVVSQAQPVCKSASGKFQPRGCYHLPPGGLTSAQFQAQPGWTTPGISGLILRQNWKDIETARGTYNYATLDYVLNTLCPRFNKPVSLQMNSGLDKTSAAIFYPSWIQNVQNGTCTNGQNTVTGLTSTTGLLVGMTLTGTGFPVNPAVLTTITSIDSATQIHISANYGGTSGTVSITFGPEMLSFADVASGTPFCALWDPTYQLYWGELITALGARYDSNPYLASLTDMGIGWGPQATFCTSAADNTVAFNGDANGGSQATFQANWIQSVLTISNMWKTAFPRTPLGWSYGPVINGAAQGGGLPFYLAQQQLMRSTATAMRINSLQGNINITGQQSMTLRMYSQFGLPVAAMQETGGGLTLAQFQSEIQAAIWSSARQIELYPTDIPLNWTPYLMYANTLLQDPSYPGPMLIF